MASTSSIASAASALNYIPGPTPNQVIQKTGLAAAPLSKTDAAAAANNTALLQGASSAVTLSSQTDIAGSSSALPVYTSSGLMGSFVQARSPLTSSSEGQTRSDILLTASPATATAFAAQSAVQNSASSGLISNLEAAQISRPSSDASLYMSSGGIPSISNSIANTDTSGAQVVSASSLGGANANTSNLFDPSKTTYGNLSVKA